MVADCVHLPYRSGLFDAVICIAMLHHLSTRERRIEVIKECLRVTKPNGRILLYAWAQDQEDGGGVSNHDFNTGSQDCLVAWHHKLSAASKDDSEEWKSGQAAMKILNHAKHVGNTSASAITMTRGKESEGIQASGYVDEEKRAVVYQRYCHVYKEGELQELFVATGMCEVEEVYMDTGNWCVIARRV